MRFVRIPRRLRWPWLHWCLFDRECRWDGCPLDIYIHPLGLIVRFREEVFFPKYWICPDCAVHFSGDTYRDHECPPF